VTVPKLVEGLTSDLVASNDSFWRFLPERALKPFDVAARQALDEEAKRLPLQTRAFEWAVQHVARRA
jgi:hypothetical protein